MTSLKFALHLTCLCVWRLALTTDPKSFSFVNQVTGSVVVNVGENLTLECSYSSGVASQFYWFKQTLGQKPRLISVYYKYQYNASFANEFKNDPRIKLDTENNKHNLEISNLRASDSATYYCAGRNALMFEFAAGFTVSVKGSDMNGPAVIYQSASETNRTGASRTLDCTVHTRTCDSEHSVYWFRNSGESQPGLIYTRGGSNDRCARKNTQTQMCFYDLNSLNVSQAETFYCAVALCGNILFGDRDKPGPKGDWYLGLYLTVMAVFSVKINAPNLSVRILSGTLAFTTILVVLLTFSIYKECKRNICQCTESQSVSTSNITPGAAEDTLHYAAIRNQKPNRSRVQKDTSESECIYTRIRQ